MKPILPYSILLAIATSTLALATDYNDQILNVDGIVPNDGIVNVTASTAAAVQVDANGVHTTLQGKITVTHTAIGGHALFLNTSETKVASINVNNVLGDVNIYTLGSGGGMGIIHYNADSSNVTSKITVDAGSYNLNISKTGTKTGYGYGVFANDGGKIDITAKNVTVDYESTGDSYGVYASGANSILNITAEKVTAKGGYSGVAVNSGGVLNISGDVDVTTSRTDAIGLDARRSGLAATALTVNGHTTVSGIAKYGVRAYYKGTVTLKGGLTANQAKLGATAAVYAYGGTVKDGIANGTGGTKYDISGQMKAQTYSGTVGTIDLHMGADSTFTGYTTEVAAADVINIELSNGAQWTNTAASTMSNLSLLVNSTIAFNKSGTNTFYNINSAAVMLAEGSLLKVDLADTFTGDVTLFSGITTTTTTWNGGTDVENAILLNAAGTTKFIYTNPSAGVFRITGSVLVPEPTTASLTLLGLASLMMRRRRVIV